MPVDIERKQYVFDKIGYKPHSAKQGSIHWSPARFKILACGRRYGKTTIGGREMTAAIVDPERAGYYWIVGPKYTTGEKEFRIVHNDLLHKLRFPRSQMRISYNVKQGDMRIEFKPTGSILEVKSAQHQDTLLGEGLAGAIMSEAARHTSDTWDQYVRPALSDIQPWGERGWAIFPSTPRGYNWFQGLYLLGEVSTPGYESWRLPSWENPIVFPGGYDDPEIQAIKKERSNQWFDQEIAALFTAFTGKIYPDFDPKIHVKPIEYNPLWSNVWALDYGWSNPFCCYDVMIDPEDTFYVWREYQVKQVSTWEHGKALIKRDNPQYYHVDWGGGDPRGPDQAATITLATGVQIYSEDIGDGDSHESWVLGIEHMRSLIKVREDGKPKFYIDPSCTELIRQLEQLRTADEKEDKNSPEQQHKHDDHGPDAIRYLVGQYFESGAGSSLSDIYSPGQQVTEAQTFFQSYHHLARNTRF